MLMLSKNDNGIYTAFEKRYIAPIDLMSPCCSVILGNLILTNIIQFPWSLSLKNRLVNYVKIKLSKFQTIQTVRLNVIQRNIACISRLT